MEKITQQELFKAFRDFNDRNYPDKMDPQSHITGVIVFNPKKSGWTGPAKNYNLLNRSYRVCSDDNFFVSGKISTAYYGNCLDGEDNHVRLDWYDWVADYCYLED